MSPCDSIQIDSRKTCGGGGEVDRNGRHKSRRRNVKPQERTGRHFYSTMLDYDYLTERSTADDRPTKSLRIKSLLPKQKPTIYLQEQEF